MKLSVHLKQKYKMCIVFSKCPKLLYKILINDYLYLRKICFHRFWQHVLRSTRVLFKGFDFSQDAILDQDFQNYAV